MAVVVVVVVVCVSCVCFLLGRSFFPFMWRVTSVGIKQRDGMGTVEFKLSHFISREFFTQISSKHLYSKVAPSAADTR